MLSFIFAVISAFFIALAYAGVATFGRPSWLAGLFFIAVALAFAWSPWAGGWSRRQSGQTVERV